METTTYKLENGKFILHTISTEETIKVIKTPTEYKPDLSAAQVMNRFVKAYTYAIETFNNETPVSHRNIDLNKHFGIYSNPLSKYLRAQLLICVDNSYGGQGRRIGKKYILNTAGATYIKKCIDSLSLKKNDFSPTKNHTYKID